MDATASRQGHPRVVLVHDWLTGMRGGEKCLEVLARRWPDARLFTLLHKRGSVSPAIEQLRPRTSFLDQLPGAHRYYRYLLPLMPAAVASWRLPPADLVVSFSHCVAKAARAATATPHVCYCFTPMRYVWHLRDAYFGGRFRGLSARLLERVLDALRDWDRRTAAGVRHFIAISRTVQGRIRECYGRDSAIVYPPVDTDFYTPAPIPREDFYLVGLRLRPVQAARPRRDGVPTARPTVGRHRHRPGFRPPALPSPGPTSTSWAGRAMRSSATNYAAAGLCSSPARKTSASSPSRRWLAGAPVIALGQGGATETVVPLESSGRSAPTGVWFSEQTADSLADAITRFERHADAFDPAACRRQALRFAAGRFAEQLFAVLDDVLRPSDTARRAA